MRLRRLGRSKDPNKGKDCAPPGGVEVAEADHTRGLRWYFDAIAPSAK
jgi:hypothetical protein